MLRGDKAAVIYGDGVISGAVASAFARAGRPVEQIAARRRLRSAISGLALLRYEGGSHD
jgi:hypothetical protein